MSEQQKDPPYLAITLDAKRRAALVALAVHARGLGLSRNDVVAGLLDMWEECWRKRSTTLTSLAVLGCFGADITSELQEFGFLELQLPDRTFRAKGAGKYLRIPEGQRKGGHASKGNLIPGARQKKAKALAESQPRGSREGSRENSSRLALGSSREAQNQPREVFSALLGSSTQHPTPNTQQLLKEEEEALSSQSISAPPKRRGDSGISLVPPEALSEVVTDGAKVWEHYRRAFGVQRLIPSEDERNLIASRYRDGYTTEGLLRAIDGVKRSGWHEKKGQVKLEAALKDGDRVENAWRWLQRPPDEKESKGRASEADRDWSRRTSEVDEDGEVML